MSKHPSPNKTTKKIKSLYVHIPFCHHLCHYCDFPKMLYDQKMAFFYMQRLFQELDLYQIPQVETIYVGGGTPSSLDLYLLKLLLEKLQPHLSIGGEFTFELNVENTTPEKLAMLRDYGVNRLSIGVQSTDPLILKSLNRRHDFFDVQKLILEARELGFSNINLDLIYGVPSQDLQTLKNDIEKLVSLSPEHLSIYSLTVHPGTMFYLQGVKEQNEDDSRQHYDVILNQLRGYGYQRYEISNFAKPGYQSKHNMTYWRNDEYYGIGLGASGYVHGIRYDNTRNMNKYLRGEYRATEDKISVVEDEKYFWMLNLRLEEGFRIDEYVTRYGINHLEEREKTLRSAFANGLMLKSGSRIAMSDDGLMILDRILLEII